MRSVGTAAAAPAASPPAPVEGAGCGGEDEGFAFGEAITPSRGGLDGAPKRGDLGKIGNGAGIVSKGGAPVIAAGNTGGTANVAGFGGATVG